MRWFLILMLVVALAGVATASPCNATFNLTTSSVGPTYVSWMWDAGITPTHIYIDGVDQGAIPSDTSVLKLSGLFPSTPYTITVVNAANTSACTQSTGDEVATVVQRSPVPVWVVMVAIAGMALLVTRKKRD